MLIVDDEDLSDAGNSPRISHIDGCSSIGQVSMTGNRQSGGRGLWGGVIDKRE